MIIQISDNFDIRRKSSELENIYLIEFVFISDGDFNNIYLKVTYLMNPFLQSVFLSVDFFTNRASIPTNTFETHVTVAGFKFEKNRKMESFYSKYSLGRVEKKHKSGTSITDRTI